MIAGTLQRYFGMRFLSAVLAVFAGTLALTAMIDFLELMRRTVGDSVGVKAAGGVRGLAAAREMIAAGEPRIGATAGGKIVQESQGHKEGGAGSANY